MFSSTSGLFFRTLAELSLSFLTKIVSTTRRNQSMSTKPVAGIMMLSRLTKQNEDCMTEGRTTSKLSLMLVTPPLLLIIQTSTGHNILPSGRCDLHCKIKETLLIRDLKSALNENVDNGFFCSLWSSYLALVYTTQVNSTFRALMG